MQQWCRFILPEFQHFSMFQMISSIFQTSKLKEFAQSYSENDKRRGSPFSILLTWSRCLAIWYIVFMSLGKFRFQVIWLSITHTIITRILAFSPRNSWTKAAKFWTFCPKMKAQFQVWLLSPTLRTARFVSVVDNYFHCILNEKVNAQIWQYSFGISWAFACFQNTFHCFVSHQLLELSLSIIHQVGKLSTLFCFIVKS